MTKVEADKLAIKLFGPHGVAIRQHSKVPGERYQIAILREIKPDPAPTPKFQAEIVAQGPTWEAAFAGAGAHIMRSFEAHTEERARASWWGRIKRWLAIPEEITQ